MTTYETELTIKFGQVYGELIDENYSLKKRVDFLEDNRRACDSIIKLLMAKLAETKKQLEETKCEATENQNPLKT